MDSLPPMTEKNCSDHHDSSGKRETLIALILNGAVSLLELVGGVASGSVAVLSDAFNNTADTLALGITYFALGKKEQPPTARETFGGKRWEIIAAFLKGGFLIATGIFIIYEGVLRFLNPEPINTTLVIVFASIALTVNLSSVFLLHKKAKDDINVHSTNLCMIYDAAASVAVIISALLAIFLPNFALYFDLIAALFIVVLMMRSGIEVVRQSLSILLQNTPADIDVDAVVRELEQIPTIEKVSDLHIWTLASGENHLTCHILLDKSNHYDCAKILNLTSECLKTKFKITHTTIEPDYTENGQKLFCTSNK